MNIQLPNGATHHVRAGDVLRYRTPHGERTGAVLRLLTFPDHVVVKAGGGFGAVVNAKNLVRLVRRGHGPEMSELWERIL